MSEVVVGKRTMREGEEEKREKRGRERQREWMVYEERKSEGERKKKKVSPHD